MELSLEVFMKNIHKDLKKKHQRDFRSVAIPSERLLEHICSNLDWSNKTISKPQKIMFKEVKTTNTITVLKFGKTRLKYLKGFVRRQKSHNFDLFDVINMSIGQLRRRN